MSERRSSRSRGTVKYSGFDDGEESDDDFAVSSHPPKKHKSSKTDDTANKSNKSVKDKSSNLHGDVKHVITLQNSQKTSKRAPLSEKIYERELQEALELSLVETGQSQDVVNHGSDSGKHQPPEALTFTADVAVTNSGQLVSSSGNICTEPHSQKTSVNTITKVTSNSRYAHGTVVVDESIELAESDNGDCSNPQQRPTRMNHDRQARKKPRLVDTDDTSSDESDFNPDDGSDEDESTICGTKNDDDDAEEEEARSNSRSKKMKATNPRIRNKSSTITSKTSNSVSTGTTKGASKVLVKSQLSESSVSGQCSSNVTLCVTTPSTVSTKPASQSKLSSQKVPPSLVSQWKPPSRASSTQASALTVRSPSSGLRLGLSRNHRVKPLHPSAPVS